MKSLMLFAAAAMALTSCDNEGMNEGIESNDTYTMTFTAGAPESRTSVVIEGDKATFSWCDDDVVGFVQSAVEVEKINKTNSNSIALESGVATFTTNFDAVDGASTYNYGAFYPGNNWKSNASFAEVKVELPAIQTLTDGSFDHEADLLMSEPIWGVANDGHGGLLKFARLAAIGKMTLKNITPGETIESVKLTFADHVLAGDVTLNFDEVTATYATVGSNSVEVKMKENGLVAKAENEIFFTCFPGEYTGAYTIEVTTTESTYIKEGNLSGKLAFTAGDVTGFGATVNFVSSRTSKTFTKVTKTNLADYSGTYLLVYEGGNIALDGSLTTLDVANNTKAVTIENDAITASVDIAFTIAKVDGGYSIQSASGYYIGSTSSDSNKLYTSQEYSADYLNTIENLVIKGTGGRSLQYNTSATRFRYYSGKVATALYRMEGTGSDEELVKALESIEVSGAKTTFTVGDEWAFGGTVTAKYNDNSTEDVTATATVDHSAVKLNIAGEYTVTVTYEDKSTTYTVTVSEEQSGVAGWVKISALSELAVGDKVALVGTVGTTNYSMKTNGTGSAPTATTVTINGNTLTSVDGITTFNIGKDGNNYILYEGDATSTWLYCTNDNNGVRSGTNSNKTWTIAAHSNSGSNFEFKHVGTSRYLGIYNNADWRCYTSVSATNFTNGKGTSDIAIYKYTAGGEGGDTPVVETLATPTGVEAIAVGKEVTIAWVPVANATSYYVTCGTQNATVTATEADFTMDEYDITYEISVVAKADGYNDSVAATTTVTTEADPNEGGGEGGGEGGEEVTVTFDTSASNTNPFTLNGSGTAATLDASISGVSVKITKESSSSNCALYSPLRFYQGHKMTFTSDKKITKIVFSYNTGKTPAKLTIATGSGSFSNITNNVGTYTCSGETNIAFIAPSQVRFNSIEVTYAK